MNNQSPPHPARGVLLLLISLLLFAALDATAKHLTATFAVPLLVWARYTFHLLLMIVFLMPTMRGRLIRTQNLRDQVLRGLFLLGTTACAVSALRTMPLAETSALVFLSPLIVTLLAGPLLGEKISGWRWVIAIAGFGGVLLIVRPGGALAGEGIAYALLSALFYSLYQLLTRKLSAAENSVTLLFYTALVGSVASSAALPWLTWTWDGALATPLNILLIASLGIYGGAGHFLVIRALHHAPASTLSPYFYVQLIWSTLLGWLLFDHFPDAWALTGMGVIAASGVAIALTSRRATADTDRAY